MAEPLKIVVTPGLTCPKCGAEECFRDPTSPTGLRFNIRAYRVGDAQGRWWSECLKCGEWF